MAFNRTTRQVTTSRTTYSAIVGSAAFQAGVKDYQTGVVAFDKYTGKAAWHYERGRLFAACRAGEKLPVPPSRNGRNVSRDAINALYGAFRIKAVI